jgi:hypothetical protein
MDKNQKGFIPIIIAIVVLGVAAGGVFYYYNFQQHNSISNVQQNNTENTSKENTANNSTATTEEDNKTVSTGTPPEIPEKGMGPGSQGMGGGTPPEIPQGSAGNQSASTGSGTPPDKPSGSSETSSSSSATEPTTDSTGYYQSGGTVTKSGVTYTATSSNASAVFVDNSGKLTLNNSTIKKSGDSSSNDESSFYGLNAAVLAKGGSTITMSGGTITASGTGSNGAFATESGSTVNLSDLTIYASGGGAHGVMATQGGVMNLTNVNMTTTSSNSGAIATDRGSGTITATGGKVATTGTDSPGIYSTGKITVSEADVSATSSEAAVIEGSNSITLKNVKLSTSVASKWGIMIYQSFSGDAEGSTGTFTMSGGTLTCSASTSPLFYVNNATGVISLTGVTVSNASNVLINAAANSRWGTSGSNGGKIVFTAVSQSLSGNVVADSISTVNLALKTGSTLSGAINSANTAKNITLSLDSSSKWIVAANSHITVLSDSAGISGTSVANIIGNGNNVYYDSSDSSNSYLGAKTYSLSGGGSLIPE